MVVPSRLTVPLSVAIVPVTLVAASVMTAGGLASWVRSSSPSSPRQAGAEGRRPAVTPPFAAMPRGHDAVEMHRSRGQP